MSIVITPAFVEDLFNRFNKDIFMGKLNKPHIEISSAKRTLGMVKYRQHTMPNGTKENYDIRFLISRYCADLATMAEVEDIVLHEMIHFFIISNNIPDTGPHGKLFKQLMDTINACNDRHIMVRRELSPAEKEERQAQAKVERRKNYVCVTRFTNGNIATACVAESRLFKLWDAMPVAFTNVEEMKWYFTTNPFFNRYPRILKPKLYKADKEELLKALEESVELVREGHTIRAKG